MFTKIKLTFCVGVLLSLTSLGGFSQLATFTNPVIPGAYPDPGICRVGDDFYLSNSSFEYFPGVPIWHSKDLVHWEHAGFGIQRKSQLNFEGLASSAGAWASSINHHNGIFYLPFTWVDWRMKVGFKNVVLTATSPAGPWSDPYTVTDTIWGIDPALFFDDDGKAYWLMNHPAVGFSHPGASSIMLQEMDLKTMKLVGKPSFIGRGAMLDSKYPEGPKLFKKDDYYYLLVAEGGTGQYHAVTISRSKNIVGPYENYEGNPILTHRSLAYTHPYINIGHADMVETSKGEWWMVCLGSRPLAGKDNILGRETFLVPVQWKKGEWPIVNPGYGQVRQVEKMPNLPKKETPAPLNRDEFDSTNLSHVWTFIRTPQTDFYSLRKGAIQINLLPQQLNKVGSPAFIGQRLKYRSGEATTKLTFSTKVKNEESGLVIYKSEKAFVKFVIGNKQISIIQQKDSLEKMLYTIPTTAKSTELKVIQKENRFSFSYKTEIGTWTTALDDYNGSIFSVEQSGGFMGTFVGIYAGSRGISSKNSSTFDYFEYKPL